MSEVPRFNISGYSSIDLSADIEIQPSDDGHWVRAGDYSALQACFEEHLEAWRVNSRTQGERIAELERENAELCNSDVVGLCVLLAHIREAAGDYGRLMQSELVERISDQRELLREFAAFQLSDYTKMADAAKIYCRLRRRARKLGIE